MRGRYSRGRGNGRGRGGSRGNYRGGGGGRRHGGGNGNYRRDNNYNSNFRGNAASGNLRERIAVESGFLVLIDQFMLANPQFQEELQKLIDKDPSEKDTLIKKYGGTVVTLEPGNYKIIRNPYSFKIIIHNSTIEEELDADETAAAASVACGEVLVDTRCLAMIDRELLDDTDLLQKYQQLWFSEQEKACRDLLRDNGGAVRYGFQRFGDELLVNSVPNENTICLQPRVQPAVDEQPAA